MNVFIKSTLAAVMAASTLFPMVAGATSGEVKITGTVFSATCQLNNSANDDVKMGRINAADFTAINTYRPVGGKELKIKLTGCSPHTKAVVRFNGDNAPGNGTVFGVKDSEGNIRDDLAIALYENDRNTQINKGNSGAEKNLEFINNTLTYVVYYQSLKATVKGNQANSNINFEITYS